MSTRQRRGPTFIPASEEGLNSRYGPTELLEQLKEQNHESRWMTRINDQHELTASMGGMFYTIRERLPDDKMATDAYIRIDDQHIWNLEDME